MADDFDPDAYLAGKQQDQFDPDAYLAGKAKPERSVLQRAGEAAKETFLSGARAWMPPSKEEAQSPLSSLGRAHQQVMSPITMTLGTAGSFGGSLLASGASELARVVTGGDPKRSEEMYEHALPMGEAALSALGTRPGIAGAGKYPMPDPRLPTVRKVPAKTPEAEAARYLELKANDPGFEAKLAAPIEEIAGPGDLPSTFQHTGVTGIGQAEKAAARRPGQVEEHLDLKQAQNAARQKALEDLQPAGAPTAVSEHLRDTMRVETAAADEAARLAQQRAWEETQRIGGTNDPTTYGNIFRRELEIAEAAARQRERDLWRAVDPNGTLQSNPQSIQVAERGIYGPGNMTEAGSASITPAERQITDLIQNYRNVIPFRELTDLRSLVSTALREELYGRGQTPAYGRLSRLRQAIEDAIPGTFTQEGQLGTGAAERLRAASAATRERAETFRPTRAITRREGVAGPYKLEEPGTIPGKLIAPGPKGYDTASNYLRAVGNERGLPELQDATAAMMRREVINPDGTINPRKLEGWLRRYQDVLRAIDERDGGAFSQRLRNVGTAQEAIEAAEARQAAVTARYKNDQLKGLLGATDDVTVERVIGGIFGRNDAVPLAQQLMDRLRGNGAAIEGARAAVVRHIRERLTSNAPIGPGLDMNDLALRAEQFQKWVTNRGNNAALRVIMRPEQVDSLERIALSLRRATRTNQTKAVGGGSDTYQNFLAGEEQAGALTELAKRWGPWIGRAITTGLGHTFGGFAGGAAAVAAEAGIQAVRTMRAAKKAKRIQNVQELFDEAILNPEKARALLGKKETYKPRMMGQRAGEAYAIGAERTRERRPERALRQTGGGVPAIGGTGGRSPGTTTPLGPRAARAGTGQALSDGGEAGEQQAAPVGGRERLAAALQSSVAGAGGLGSSKRKPSTALTREEIVKQLRGRGLSTAGWEAPSGFGESRAPEVDSRQRGGAVGYLPREHEEEANWPKGVIVLGGGRENVEYPYKEKLASETAKAAINPITSPDLMIQHRLPPQWLRMTPEGYRGVMSSPAATGGVERQSKMEGAWRLKQPFKATNFTPPTLEMRGEEPSGLALQLGYSGIREPGTTTGPTDVPLPRARPYADGGEVDDDKLPLPGQSRGLGRAPDEELPAMRRNKAGETLPGYIVRNWGEGLAHLAGTPGRVYREGMTEEDVDFGPSMALNMMGARAPTASTPGIGMFGGRGAKTANLDALKKAEEMRAEGAPRESIRNRTGWFRDPAGDWMFEIPDTGSYVKPTGRIYQSDWRGEGAASRPSLYAPNVPLEDVLHHPRFFEAYPQFKDMPTTLELGPEVKPGGGYTPPGHQGLLGLSRLPYGAQDVGRMEVRAPVASEGAGSPYPARRIILHEGTHGVQSQEGFTQGGNPNALPYSPRQITNMAKKAAEEAGIPWEMLSRDERAQLVQGMRVTEYKRILGEGWARAVEARRNLTPEALMHRPPWKDLDVPWGEVRIPKDEGVAMGLKPLGGKSPWKKPEPFQAGGVVRSILRNLPQAEKRMLEASRGEAPIKGLPQKPLDVGGEAFIPGPSADVRELARQYMAEKGLPYTPVENYVPVDENRARAIARAYDAMKHQPESRAVQRAYEALANETRDQYEVLKRTGAKFEPLPPGPVGSDPYAATPRLAAKDFLENKHMYYFPTEEGFGTEASGLVPTKGQKMLEPSGVKIAGKEVPFNDLFRIVHDVFGHHKEGVGFRAAGEENAWRSHGRMYSPKALPAMTSETRGQNSWVNFGPYAAENKGASGAETIYAPQKLGIIPSWVVRAGRMYPLGLAGAAVLPRGEGGDELDAEAAQLAERPQRKADGGEVDVDSRQPPLPDAVMDAWERGAMATRRGVLGAQTMEGRGRPGSKFFEDPGQKEEAQRRIIEATVPDSPLDLGLMALGGPFRIPIKVGALALGAALEPSEVMAGKVGAARKAIPAAGRSVTRSHNMPPEPVEAPFPQYAEEYPPVGPPTLKPKEKKPGEFYPEKTLTPEAEEFMKRREKIRADMKKQGFKPYFDPTERTHVDPSNYPPPNVDTSTIQPKKEQTIKDYLDVINLPGTRQLLREAYARGQELGDANDWYAMAQLEAAYIKELGLRAGRQAFLDEFAAPMAATTSGQNPTGNYLMAHYLERQRKRGEEIPEGHQIPAPVGGRRVAMNIRDYKAMREKGGYQGFGEGQPKMHDFSRSLIGDLSHGVVDEQMAEGQLAHYTGRKGATKEQKKFPDRARRQAYGLLQKPIHEEAAAAGVEPGRYQDIAWAGFKGEPGKPMIQHINEAIERTHRLTGMPRDEIVRRGIIRKEIPIYGFGAAGAPALLRGQQGEDGSSSPSPGPAPL